MSCPVGPTNPPSHRPTALWELPTPKFTSSPGRVTNWLWPLAHPRPVSFAGLQYSPAAAATGPLQQATSPTNWSLTCPLPPSGRPFRPSLINWSCVQTAPPRLGLVNNWSLTSPVPVLAGQGWTACGGGFGDQLVFKIKKNFLPPAGPAPVVRSCLALFFFSCRPRPPQDRPQKPS